MVTQIRTETQSNPFIALDISSFADKQSHSAEEVRQTLLSRIPSIEETPIEEFDDDREARAAQLRNRKDKMAYNNALKDLELFDKDPQTYTTLFSLKENTNGELYTAETNENEEHDAETEKAHAKICEDQNGNLLLAVEIMKPSDVSFRIQDGKLSFDPNGMSPDQLKEILSWLDHRGLISYLNMDDLKLDNADSQTEEMFDQAKQELESQTKQSDETFVQTTSANTLSIDQSANDNTHPSDEEQRNDGMQESRFADGNEEDLPFDTSLSNKALNRNRAPAGAYDNAIESITKWMDKNKRRNLSYFVSHQGGYTVFTTFDKENPDNMKLDGILDKKTKDIKVRSECKLYVKMDKDGRLEVSFSVPSGKPLSDNYADRIMDTYKDAGISHVKFGTMTDANEGAIRAACGRAMMVPLGLKLSQTKFDKMIEAAESKNGKNNPKVIKYRRDLALEFARQLQNKGIDWQSESNKNNVDCRCVRHAIGAYDYAPFRDLWEDFGLRDQYENIVKSNGSSNPNGAAETIGAAMAVAKVYAAYSEGIGAKNTEGTLDYFVSDKCQSLTPEEKEKFREVIRGSEKTQVRDIPPEAAKKLFSFMQQTQATRASKKINDEYTKLVKDEFYKGNPTRDAVNPYLSEASTEIENVKNELADIGLPPILIIRLGSPKHDFREVQSRLKEEREQARSSANNGRDNGRNGVDNRRDGDNGRSSANNGRDNGRNGDDNRRDGDNGRSSANNDRDNSRNGVDNRRDGDNGRSGANNGRDNGRNGVDNRRDGDNSRSGANNGRNGGALPMRGYDNRGGQSR